MTNSLSLVLKNFGLTKGNFNYSTQANAFLSTGYTSAAGNTYFNVLRFADGIIIKEDVGQGWLHLFLNGLRIYSVKDKTLLADKTFHSTIYSKDIVKREATNMLFDVLNQAADKEGYILDHLKARKKIEKIIDNAMNKNQNEMIEKMSEVRLLNNC